MASLMQMLQKRCPQLVDMSCLLSRFISDNVSKQTGHEIASLPDGEEGPWDVDAVGSVDCAGWDWDVPG